MNYKKIIIAIAMASSISPSFADEVPFEVSLGTSQRIPRILIETVVDQVTVTGYSVNRGNCDPRINQILSVPTTFKFGQSYGISAPACNVKEISIDTNLGTYVYSFGAQAAQRSNSPAKSPAPSSSGNGEACLKAKIKAANDEGYPVSNDVYNEWRGECGLAPKSLY